MEISWIFYLSLRFYVKLILGIVEVQNQPVQLTHLEDMNFDFHEFLHFLKAENRQIRQILSPENGKNSILRASRTSKIDFT